MPAGRVIGHRGAPRLAPENTLECFRAAARSGCSWIETDVSLLGDGTPVICHDGDLKRIAGRPEALREVSCAELARLAPDVPTLDDALELFGDYGLSVNLDVKVHGGEAGAVADATLAALKRRDWPMPRLVVSSFSMPVLERMRLTRADVPLGILCDAPPPDWRETARRLGAATIHPGHRHLSAALVTEMIAAGLAVLTWTVNDPDDAIRLWRWGVAGVITDDPDALFAVADDLV